MSEENDLFLLVLDYRSAPSGKVAEECWQELKACVDRLIAEEREKCAKICESILSKRLDNGNTNGFNAVSECIEAIREGGVK